MSDSKSGLIDRVRGAILWRSGSQILAQLVTWTTTFLVIRMLGPSEYGLFAMTQAILALLSLMAGHGFANALVRRETISPHEIRQVFGMLVLLNVALAGAQVVLAPLAAAYFRQPMVADLLRVQALIYLATPLIALPQALLARRMNFKRQAQVHLLAASLGAGTALAAAASGWGVWTLVAAALAYFWTQAVGLTLAARSLVWPSFRFAGAAHLYRYGGAMVAIQCCWFVQIQADIFIAGRITDPYRLGLYTTSLFLTQIFATKFVPPLNDVAFAAYAQMKAGGEAVASAFLKAVRLVMLLALPFYLGLAVTAEPLVAVVLGPKWTETAGLVRLLALAMPFMTLQIMFQPATNALGHARISLKVAAAGAAIMTACFLVGIQWGMIGLAWAWLIGMPFLTLTTIALALPAIGACLAGLGRAVLPGLAAAGAMAIGVVGLDRLVAGTPDPARLAILVGFGVSTYCALLFLFARPLVRDVLDLALRRKREVVA